jgi:hypothetical protein
MHTSATPIHRFAGERRTVSRVTIAALPSISPRQAGPSFVVRFLTRALVLGACSFLIAVSLVVPHPATAIFQEDATTAQRDTAACAYQHLDLAIYPRPASYDLSWQRPTCHDDRV